MIHSDFLETLMNQVGEIMKYFLFFSNTDYSTWTITGIVGMTTMLKDCDEKPISFVNKENAKYTADMVLTQENYVYIISLDADTGVLKLEDVIY